MPSLNVSDHRLVFKDNFLNSAFILKIPILTSSYTFFVIKWKVGVTRNRLSPFRLLISPSSDKYFHMNTIFKFSVLK